MPTNRMTNYRTVNAGLCHALVNVRNEDDRMVLWRGFLNSDPTILDMAFVSENVPGEVGELAAQMLEEQFILGGYFEGVDYPEHLNGDPSLN